MLVESGIGVLLSTATRVFIGSLTKGFETVDLTANLGDRLVGASLPAVGASSRANLGMDVNFLLEFLAA